MTLTPNDEVAAALFAKATPRRECNVFASAAESTVKVAVRRVDPEVMLIEREVPWGSVADVCSL